MGVSQNWGYHSGGPHNKDSSILGSIWGSPYLGKVPYSGNLIEVPEQQSGFQSLGRLRPAFLKSKAAMCP